MNVGGRPDIGRAAALMLTCFLAAACSAAVAPAASSTVVASEAPGNQGSLVPSAQSAVTPPPDLSALQLPPDLGDVLYKIPRVVDDGGVTRVQRFGFAPLDVPSTDQASIFIDVTPRGSFVTVAEPVSGGYDILDASGADMALAFANNKAYHLFETQADQRGAFFAYIAEPEMEVRKRLGVKVVLFLIFMTGITYAVKRRVWAEIH